MHTRMELNGRPKSARLPSLNTPATELASKYDNLFKTIISAGWAVASDGNVEAPSGYFARVEIPAGSERDSFIDMLSEWPDLVKLFGEIEPGWYLTQENESGIIWVYWSNEPQVTDAYHRLGEQYTEWENE